MYVIEKESLASVNVYMFYRFWFYIYRYFSILKPQTLKWCVYMWEIYNVNRNIKGLNLLLKEFIKRNILFQNHLVITTFDFIYLNVCTLYRGKKVTLFSISIVITLQTTLFSIWQRCFVYSISYTKVNSISSVLVQF